MLATVPPHHDGLGPLEPYDELFSLSSHGHAMVFCHSYRMETSSVRCPNNVTHGIKSLKEGGAVFIPQLCASVGVNFIDV